MTKLQERLVDAYVVLVMAGKKTIDDVPIELKEFVEIAKRLLKC